MKNRRVLACALLSLSLLSQVAHAQPAGNDPVALYQEGVAAAKAERYEEAYTKLSRSFELKPSLDTAANLSFVEGKLGKKRDAAKHLAYAIRVHPSTGPTEKRERMERDLQVLEAQVGRVTIDCPAGALVSIDGVLIGVAPVEVQYVDPGARVVTAKHETLGAGESTVEVAAGQALTLKLALKRGGTTPLPPDDRPIWPAALLGGVAAVGLGLGITGIVLRQTNRADADKAAELAGTDCGPQGASCTSIQDSLEAANRFLGMGIAGFAIAGAAGIGAIVYAVWPSETTPSSAQLRVVPSLGGLFLEGTF